MVREIKFRAWDILEKRMIAVPSLIFGDDGSALTTIIWQKTRNGHDRSLTVGETAELMQFTGLKDDNGREIYEGDVLKWDHTASEDDHGVSPVAFQNAQFCLQDSYGLECFRYRGLGSNQSIRVIGNIYENPDLVKEGRG